MQSTNDKSGDGKIGFIVNNSSTLMLRMKVWCDFKVYGTSVEYSDDFKGEKIWIIYPKETCAGWFDIKSLLVKRGKTIQQMINEYSEENRANQFTVDLIKIEFRDELENIRILPSRRYYFAFNDWKLIPVLTVRKDW